MPVPGETTVALLRRDDFLVLEFGLVNLDLAPDQTLVRRNPGDPAFVVVRFAPQHVAEQAYPMNAEFQGPVDAPPVGTLLAGGSRLAFRVPDVVDSIPFTAEGLLGWERWEPSLAANALPSGATEGPAPAMPGETETAIEFPHRLVLSPDAGGQWLHRIAVIAHEARAELWHTRLGSRTVDAETGAVTETDGERDVRFVAFRDRADPFLTSLSRDERRQISQLSANFGIQAAPGPVLRFFNPGLRFLRFRRALQRFGVPARYTPLPAAGERLQLSSLAASARLAGAWEYPVLSPEAAAVISLPEFSLQKYQHIAGLGRDQYVRTVTRGWLAPTGHRAALIKITERMFSPKQVGATPQGAVFGATAYLRQYEIIVVQQPEMDYAGLAGGYAHDGREMPLRRIRLTTLQTPKLDPRPGMPLNQSFWIRALSQDVLFGAIGTDVEGNLVSFELPLIFVRQEALTNHPQILGEFRTGPQTRRTRPLGNQAVVFAPSGDRPGSTRLKVASLTFDMELPSGTPLALKSTGLANVTGYPARWLPYVAGASASIPAVEQLLGSAAPVDIRPDPRYLAHDIAGPGNPGQTFVELVNDLPLKFPAEKAGGLARPDMGVKGLSRALGPVSNPADLANLKFDTSIFAAARFLGGISLADILPREVAIDMARAAPREISDAELDDPGTEIPAPILLTRPVMIPGNPVPQGAETRFLWKPKAKDFKLGSFFTLHLAAADFLLDARMRREAGGEGSFVVAGRLRNFALEFVSAMKVTIAELAFRAEAGKKMEVGAKNVDMEFLGPLAFVNTLRQIMPADGFDDPPYVTVDTQGILAGYTLGIPTFGVGIFSIQNIALSAALSVPFVDKPAGVRFAVSERHKPFIVTVTLFGGGGFFALALSAKGLEQVEAAIEFGGNISLNLGVASGGVYVMAGIYFNLTGSSVTLTGYLRCGGYLEVLGIISISIEFYLAFTYRKKDGQGSEVWGQASVTVKVKVLFFSASVTLSVERRFAGAGGDPTFAQTVNEDEWAQYLLAYA